MQIEVFESENESMIFLDQQAYQKPYKTNNYLTPFF